jgi:hypothetical protein
VGGRGAGNGIKNEAYTSKDGTNFKKLTSLTGPISYPCLVIVDDDTLFMAGGSPGHGQGTGKSYIYTKTR